VVQFDVAANGVVTSAVVVESSNSVFEAAAIKAAERFKFKPRVVDGVALATYGIQNLFRFTLDDL
jgi:protein TonB